MNELTQLIDDCQRLVQQLKRYNENGKHGYNYTVQRAALLDTLQDKLALAFKFHANS